MDSLEIKSFDQFRAEWLSMRPSRIPVRSEPRRNYPAWFGKATIVMFVCAAIISGVHTVPAIYAGIEISVPQFVRVVAALSSFGAIELSIFIASYSLSGRRKSALMGLTLVFSLLLAIVTNTQSNLLAADGLDVRIDANFLHFVSVLMGALIPSLAATAGKAFVNVHLDEQRANAEVDAELSAANIRLDEEIAGYYAEYVRDETAKARRRQTIRTKQLPAPESASGTRSPYQIAESASSPARTNGGVGGYQRSPLGVRGLLDVFRTNPELINRTPADIEAEYGAKSTTYFEAKRLYRQEAAAALSAVAPASVAPDGLSD